MTLETCKKRYEIAKKKGDEKDAEFWLERGRGKVARHQDIYKNVDVNAYFGLKKKGEPDGKKSKG